VDIEADTLRDRQTDAQAGGHAYGYTETWTDRWTDRRILRLVDIETDTITSRQARSDLTTVLYFFQRRKAG
jgi:hypothetical protein